MVNRKMRMLSADLEEKELRNQIKTFEITENNQNLNKNLRKNKTSEKKHRENNKK